jgi:hypothetical protein
MVAAIPAAARNRRREELPAQSTAATTQILPHRQLEMYRLHKGRVEQAGVLKVQIRNQ